MRLTSGRAYSRPATVPTMPPGLIELMNGLAKDVLRHNPDHVYEFCANHMEKLLEIRDGPSSKIKKSMTLEQKIENAQEKVRQRAKERCEKFDREINLFNSQQATNQDTENVPVDQSSGGIVKALVHHEVDLLNASEVEISHTEKNMTKVNDNSNPKESKETHENKPEPVIHSAEIKPDTKIDLEEIKVKNEENVVNQPIFEKIESGSINETSKETELKGITELHVGDSPLQTITEASEENLMNENVTVLPKITIGDGPDMRELENISGESLTETQLDNVKAENDAIMSSDVQSNGDKSEANTVTHRNTDSHSSNGPESVSNIMCSENIMSNVNISSEDNHVEITSVNVHKHGDVSDKSELITDAAENARNLTDVLDDGGIQQTGDGDNDDLDTSTKHKNDEQKFEVPSLQSNVSRVTGEPPKDDVPNDIIQNEEQPAAVTSDNLNVSGKKEAIAEEINAKENTPDGHDLPTRNQGSDSNITDNNKVDAGEIENKVDKETNNSDSEKPQDNSESSYPKSESNGNTNEDSMSMIESDLSKTDEDTNQNNPNMDLETAAVTIQKVFRSFMFKSRNSTFEESINDENNSVDEDNEKKEEYYVTANLNKERRTLGITRMESVLQTVNEEKSLSLSTDDSSTLSSAATTIQAHVRGFLVRNRLNSSKTFSMNSLVNSHEALESDPDQHKNKTILNIHIVPEEGNFMSRDESLITSMDLSLDGSPPSSVNLHPMSCDIVSERRKMLKREDAVQSVSPPSNNSGKLSEDSVKEVLLNENSVLEENLTEDITMVMDDQNKELDNDASDVVSSASTMTPTTIITISKSEDLIRSPRDNSEGTLRRNVKSFNKLSSDESDVITPFPPSPRSSEDGSLLHSGEFHDVVLPTKVSRNDTPVVREFQNVLVYFLLWNSS